MLTTLSKILAMAEEKQVAIGAFNCPNLESVQAVIEAAEELRLPVILQHAQCHESWIPVDLIGPIMLSFAKKASIPVAVHLDHGDTVDYLHKALEIGFTSVMIDASALPFDENVKLTKEVVQLAAQYGADVEAELGSMGVRESGAGDHSGAEDTSKIYTDPMLAKQFASDTGIHALACSFGTTHGIYITKPCLDFDVVRNVRNETNGIPVVMHGGSGVSAQDIQEAIRAGVRKINYFTYMDKSGGNGAADYLASVQPGMPLLFSSVLSAARHEMTDNVKEAMETFAMMK